MRKFDTQHPLHLIDFIHLIPLLILLAAFIPRDVTVILASPKPSKNTTDLQPGSNFATGSIDFGGLIVTQSSTFNRVWRTHEGGPNDQGATFYEPSSLSNEYYILGHYSHENKYNKKLDDRVLIVKDDATGAVAKPLNYTLLWSSENLKNKENGVGYVWQPVPPKGYVALGHIVTTSPEMPSLDKVRCVRSDFVKECSDDEWIWGEGGNGVNFFKGKSDSSVQNAAEHSVHVGAFKAKLSMKSDGTKFVHCLKNSKVYRPMPNLDQIRQLMTTYGPLVYFHPKEKYLPSSVEWYFKNGALLHNRGNEVNPVTIDTSQYSNLPQNTPNNGSYWFDIPKDKNVKKGDLNSAKGYLHIKQVEGGIVTDIAVWLFFPFNGPARARFLFFTIPLGRMGSHVGDWEHVTMRINNFDGKLLSIYFSRHSKGRWVNAADLEYTGSNKPRVFASLNGHAMFAHPGLFMQGNKLLGFRNDMARSNNFLDIGATYEIVSAEYLGIRDAPWLDYCGQWGPNVTYKMKRFLLKFKKFLIFNKIKRKYENFINGLPKELFGEEGPIGPKLKPSWNGYEE